MLRYLLVRVRRPSAPSHTPSQAGPGSTRASSSHTHTHIIIIIFALKAMTFDCIPPFPLTFS